MLYLTKIVGIKSYYLTNRLGYQPMFFWNIFEPTTRLVAWIIMGYHIIAYLNQVGIIIINIIIHNYFSWRSFQRCFFDMACD